MTRKRRERRGGGTEKRSSTEAYEESLAATPPQTEPPRTRRRGETLQELLTPDVASMKIDIHTVDLNFEYMESQEDIDDQELIKPFKDKIPISKYPIEAKRARGRMYARKNRARMAAKKAKVEVLEVLKAELEAEVQKLQARVAALPGSAVWHS